MTNINFSVLKQNINMLMEQNGMHQDDLAELLNMSQSNVSRCLKPDDDSRRFTLEQVYAIADHFNVSLDQLLGRISDDRDYTAEDICRLFSFLISKYKVVHFSHEVEEEIWDPFRYESKKKNITYDAFYFPNYYAPMKYFDEFRWEQAVDEIRATGNELTENIAINNFLERFIDAFEKYDSYVYKKEDFDILVDAYFKILKK